MKKNYILLITLLASLSDATATDSYYIGANSGNDYRNLDTTAIWSNGFNSSYDFIADISYTGYLSDNKVKTLVVNGAATTKTSTINSITLSGNAFLNTSSSGFMR